MNPETGDSTADQHWHDRSAPEVCTAFSVAPASGLTSAEARTRLQQHGANRLAQKPPRPRWRIFAHQFRSLLIGILIGAAALAALIGDLKNAAVIVVVVCINAVLGFIQEHRAENALAALRSMLAPTARVRRDGETRVVPATELVPGDILLLEAGDRIPADARVLAAHGAETAEAALTGESSTVCKSPAAVAAGAPLGEQSGMVFMNTVLTRGRIEAVVTATGMHTATGELAGLLADTAQAATPLQLQLDALGKRLALLAGAVISLMFIAGLLRGDDPLVTAMTAIALAVAAIPEGLPAVVTVTLALGMRRMARRHVIIKRLAAVETLGCTTVICSDKTGTLTLNQMTARALYAGNRRYRVEDDGDLSRGHIIDADGTAADAALQQLLLPAALCTDAILNGDELIGDPTEGALLALAIKAGINPALRAAAPRIAELPFDSAHKLMATFHADGDAVQLWVKGAPGVLLERSSRVASFSGSEVLDRARREQLRQAGQEFANDAMRVLALAGRRIDASAFNADGDLMRWVAELDFCALIGIIDPPRPEARESIAQCLAAGLEVKMITGDHPLTAAAIARELGLDGEVHQGHELDGLDVAEAAALIARSTVFARVAPEHKMRIVESLQAQGHVVAMTGDGVNDAPALKRADIGIAMGITGTDVSKEAATLVLTDDNFASIVRAVREGRTIYDNIVKFVRFQLSTNIGAILTVLGAPFIGLATPFTAAQILWVNIITDGPPAMTLGVEPAHPGIMQQPPRGRDATILSAPRLGRILQYGLNMAVGTLAVFAWAMQAGDSKRAMTLAFTTFALFQLFNLFNARNEHDSAFNRQFFSNAKLWAVLLAAILLQITVVHWAPAQTVFDTTALTLAEWLIATAVASSVLLLEEARKWIRR